MPPSVPFDLPQARHLLARAGFGGRPAEIVAARDAGLDATVASLLDGPTRPLPVPAWIADYKPRDRGALRDASPEERQMEQRQNREWARDLTLDWVNWMISTPTPADMLEQRMAFIWHGLFPSSTQKSRSAVAIYRQIVLFHQHARGNYGELLHGIIRDPAMIAYLDNARNRKGAINENLAREIMELFSLGRGHYTETDIQEGARALTGYTIDFTNMTGIFRPFMHDSGRKTILGRSGTFNGDDFVDIILAQPACADWIAARLWREFAGTEPDADLRHELAGVLRDAKYAIKPYLHHVFTHPRFYAADVVGQQIKSPIQFVVGTARTLQLEVGDPAFYGAALFGMGQTPYAPPNVKGWPGDRAWITTTRLLTRYTFAEVVSSGELPDRQMLQAPGMRMNSRTFHVNLDADALLAGGVRGDAAARRQRYFERLCQVLLAQPPTAAEAADLLHGYTAAQGAPEDPAALRALIGRIMLLPQYQLT